MKSKPSSGIEEISSMTLAKESLSCLCWKQLVQGNVSFELKISKVYPKYKQGRTDVLNYRPISLLPTTSKIIEKIVLNKLSEHLIPHEQHGLTR